MRNWSVCLVTVALLVPAVAVVVDVDADSPASAVGIRSRDVLVALGRFYPTTLEEFGEMLDYLDPEQEVSVTYLRVKPPTIFRYQDRLAVR